MTAILRYGVQSALRLDLPQDVLLAECDGPRGDVLGDPEAAVRSALGQPLDFPPLEQAATPGDRVVLAIDRGVPQVSTVVAPIVETLMNRGVEASNITLLCRFEDDEGDGEDPRQGLPQAIATQVRVEVHDPEDRSNLSYLAATAEGHTVYLNHRLVDADLVVPIGCFRCARTTGYNGPGGGLYPTFSDAETLKRFRARWLAEEMPLLESRSRDEVNEVLWLLGICFTVQVVPGPGDRILQVFAGLPESVSREGQARCDAAWQVQIPHRASLVVAAIEGEREQQTWANVGRALAAAGRIVAHGGAIVICCDVSADPGPALRQIHSAEDLPDVILQIRATRTSDVLPAVQLIHALEWASVFLLSRVEEDIVEELGVAAVSEPEEVVRLAGRHKSCVLLANAQHSMPMLESE